MPGDAPSINPVRLREIAARALFVKQRLPVCRHPFGRCGHRLIQRMRVRSGKLRAFEELLRTIVVKPVLARLEARDNRVTGSGAVFRCMLTWRTVAAADVSALRASAQMQPPSAQPHTFDATCSARLGGRVDTILLGRHGLVSDSCRLAVSGARIALPNFYNIAIGIANVAACLAVFGLGLGEKLGSSASP
jgi:hypothetical protein